MNIGIIHFCRPLSLLFNKLFGGVWCSINVGSLPKILICTKIQKLNYMSKYGEITIIIFDIPVSAHSQRINSHFKTRFGCLLSKPNFWHHTTWLLGPGSYGDIWVNGMVKSIIKQKFGNMSSKLKIFEAAHSEVPQLSDRRYNKKQFGGFKTCIVKGRLQNINIPVVSHPFPCLLHPIDQK